MNINVPHSWLLEYCKTEQNPKDIGQRVAISGPSIERIQKIAGEWCYDAEVTTNRIDSASIIGFAREVSAILGVKTKENLDSAALMKAVAGIASRAKKNAAKTAPHTLAVKISDKRCRRYCGVVLDGVKIGPSPKWLQQRLEQCGVRAINLVVDVTNYVMLEYGQPMHAFDADKISGAITVRAAKPKEEIAILGGEKYVLGDALVIADNEKALAIAGVKGGAAAEIDSDTRTIVLEAASFDHVSVRTAARDLNLRTDAVVRFEKNLHPDYALFAMVRAIELLEELGGARVVTPIVDQYPKVEKPRAFSFDWSTLDRMTGVEIKHAEAIKILQSLGFTVTPKKTGLAITPPFWRMFDIEGEADFVEEIVRLYGYGRLPKAGLSGEIPVRTVDASLQWETKTKHHLKSLGWTECYTYSLVDEQSMRKCGMDAVQALELYNPLSSDFRYLRPSLVPGLLSIIADHEQRRDTMQLFELSKVYTPRKQDLPIETVSLAFALSAKDDAHKNFLQLKGVIEMMMAEWLSGLRTEVSIVPYDGDDGMWDAERSAELKLKGKCFGVMGVPAAPVLKAWGLKTEPVLAVIDFTALVPHMNTGKQYTPVAKYPPVLRDLAFVIDKQYSYSKVVEHLQAASSLISHIELFDVFEGVKLGKGRHSLAFHVAYSLPERTLTAEEADVAHASLRSSVETAFGAELR